LKDEGFFQRQNRLEQLEPAGQTILGNAHILRIGPRNRFVHAPGQQSINQPEPVQLHEEHRSG
jgi:hypothetical protein